MAQVASKELHSYLDDLCKQEVYGSVTIRFNKGELTSITDALEWRPQDLKESYGNAPERTKKILIVRREIQAIKEEPK